MEYISFKVVGEIKTKQRPRATVINGHARVYPPKDTVIYENYIKTEFLRQCPNVNFKNHPIAIRIDCWFKANKEMSKYGRMAEMLPCVTHKDLDNICKLVDGLNGIAWDDDKQIVEIRAKKGYTLDEEYLLITIIDLIDEFEYRNVKDLQEKAKIDKAKARVNELTAKPKLTKAESKRLEELQTEVIEYYESRQKLH